MTPLYDVLVIGGDQALEHRDLTANGVPAFRLPDVPRLSKLLAVSYTHLTLPTIYSV